MKFKTLKMVIYEINGERFASDVMEVEKVLPYEEATKIPEAPEFILGVVDYDNGILPILSLAAKLKKTKGGINENSKIVVTKYNGANFGLIVDAVIEVREISEENIKEAPEIVSGISNRYIKGLAKINDKVIIILNLPNILNDEEKEFLQ